MVKISLDHQKHAKQIHSPQDYASGREGNIIDRAGNSLLFTEPPIVTPFTIVIDTREQAPYSFTGLRADASEKNRPLLVKTVRRTLETGDYSIEGCEREIVIERKSVEDLFGTLGGRREQFENEHRRMKEIVDRGGWAEVVVESDIREVREDMLLRSRLSPESVHGTAIAWGIRYRVHWSFMSARRYAEIHVYKTLARWWKEREG